MAAHALLVGGFLFGLVPGLTRSCRREGGGRKEGRGTKTKVCVEGRGRIK